MLLAVYHPTLSEHDQHTLACMYHCEKAGHSMHSAFLWREAALEHYSTTTDTKAVLFQTSKLEQVLDLLDERMLSRSILFYLVTRRPRVSDRQRRSSGEIRRFSVSSRKCTNKASRSTIRRISFPTSTIHSDQVMNDEEE